MPSETRVIGVVITRDPARGNPFCCEAVADNGAARKSLGERSRRFTTRDAVPRVSASAPRNDTAQAPSTDLGGVGTG